VAPDKQRPADFDKRVAIPAQGVQHPANISLKVLLVRIVPQLIISQCARYFGVQVGPVAHLDPRGPRIVRYENVVRSIRRLGLGIAQFHRSDHKLFKSRRRMLQILRAGPGHSLAELALSHFVRSSVSKRDA
jgi:hypothetical protein